MQDPTPPRRLMPPSPRYPRWMEHSGGDLMYLGWGERRFELEPVPIHRNGGWVYWLVTQGRIHVTFADGRQTFGPGEGMMAGPELAFGFQADDQHPSHILAWIWKETPPCFPAPRPDGVIRLSFSDYEVEWLDRLHRQCRHECLDADAFSPTLSTHLRGMVDILFARAASPARTSGRPEETIRLARHWMLDHLGADHPVEDLARYLHLSPVSLHRLFKHHLRESPGAHHRRLKMERARELIQRRGLQVKRVAYELGYRHPGDFSRAYSRYWGTPPSAGR